ncbi:MAG: hypothetical protein KVP17_001189 [Porospora cf. gigantea B]|uniref:uncharacterized protein n=1 Tax=Porospora cf. gigantea B TaxID=2853592 RepID=UPI003571D3E7|nr:MAG: hypothetical protein KVP17_001189 [Porospora cf. gigantea B]
MMRKVSLPVFTIDTHPSWGPMTPVAPSTSPMTNFNLAECDHSLPSVCTYSEPVPLVVGSSPPQGLASPLIAPPSLRTPTRGSLAQGSGAPQPSVAHCSPVQATNMETGMYAFGIPNSYGRPASGQASLLRRPDPVILSPSMRQGSVGRSASPMRSDVPSFRRYSPLAPSVATLASFSARHRMETYASPRTERRRRRKLSLSSVASFATSMIPPEDRDTSKVRSGRHKDYYYHVIDRSRDYRKESRRKGLFGERRLSVSSAVSTIKERNLRRHQRPLALYPLGDPTLNQGAISPVNTRSLLTCSGDFAQHYPNVHKGLLKGLLDVSLLISHEVIIPIKEEVTFNKDTIRSRRAVQAGIEAKLTRTLSGRFPDPYLCPKLVKKVAEYFCDKIDEGIDSAEDERSFFQWLLRLEVDNAIDVRVTTSIGSGVNSIIANIEGCAHVSRKKGTLLGLASPDSISLEMDLLVRALFLNGRQLLEIDKDPLFVDKVSIGDNVFAQQLVTPL